jgi:hypothetical protein
LEGKNNEIPPTGGIFYVVGLGGRGHISRTISMFAFIALCPIQFAAFMSQIKRNGLRMNSNANVNRIRNTP